MTIRTLDGYQAHALETWVGKLPNSELGRVYLGLKLAGEAGEVAEKLGKLIRDKDGLIDISLEDERALALELGDVLWYLSVLAGELGLTLELVAAMNMEKLRDRKARGVLGGSGDNR